MEDTTCTSSIPVYRDLAPLLFKGGWPTVPIKPGLKHPLQRNWPSLADGQTAEQVKFLSLTGGDWGVGIPTGRVIAVDLDVYDQSAAEQIDQLAVDRLGNGLLRIGQAPKRMRIYRSVVPFRKVTSRPFHHADQLHLIEVMGRGEQFVAFAIHPGTGRPYQWIGPSPLEVTVDQLPLVTEAAARAFVSEAERLLVKLGFVASQQEARARGRARDKARGPPTYDGLQGVLRRLESAEQHTRNNVLYWASCRFAEAINARLVSEERARSYLRERAIGIGLDPVDAERTINSAMRGVSDGRS